MLTRAAELDFRTLLDGSGFELCSRLREGAPGRGWDRDVPVIIVSSRADPVDRVRGFARGCDDYVVNALASLFPLAASGIRLGSTVAGSPDGWCTATGSWRGPVRLLT